MKKIAYILIIAFIWINNDCNSSGRIFNTSQIQKFERRKFNPRRKLSQDEQLIAIQNARRNKKQEQLVEESSGGIMKNITDEKPEKQPVKTEGKK